MATVALLLVLTGCSDEPGEAPTAGGSAASGGSVDLRAVCPEKIVVQGAWWPSMSDGVLYALLGRDLAIEAKRKRVSAPLVARGEDTGVRLEVRAGGPAIGFTQVSAQMYLDPSITIGKVGAFDEVLQLSATQPTLAVLTPLEKDPQMIMWDPQTYPEFNTVRDVGKTDTTVLYFGGDTYMEYLVGSGILKRSQVDGSFDGGPARFVAARGRIAQSGFATHDPYIYERVVKQWGKPVRYQLVYETGYPNYGSPLVIRRGDTQKLMPCLRQLVPIAQQAQVDLMADPDETIARIVRLNHEFEASTPSTPQSEAFSVGQMQRLGLVSNGPDKTLGNFDEARVQRLIDITRPIFAAQKKPVQDDLKPSDVVTNQFIDPQIGL